MVKKRDLIYAMSPLGDKAESEAEADGGKYWYDLRENFLVETPVQIWGPVWEMMSSLSLELFMNRQGGCGVEIL